MVLGKIRGKSSTNQFWFLIENTTRKFQYLKAKHKEGYEVLAQVVEIETTEDKSMAKCNILGYRNEKGALKSIKYPLEPDTEIESADDSFIEQTLGLTKSKYGAFIGKLEGKDIKVYLDLNKLLTRHCAILAKTGSGKSYSVAVLLEEILERNVPIVVIDPHGEYSTLRFPNDNDEGYERFGIKAKGYGERIIEFSPDLRKNPNAKQLSLSSKNLTGTELMHLLPAKLSGAQIGILYSAIKEMGDDIDFDALLFSLQQEEMNAKWSLINVIEYLKQLNIFSKTPTSVHHLVQPMKCTIINLKGVPEEVQEMIVYKIVKDLFNARKNNEIPPFFLVLEEAHNFCLSGDVMIATEKGKKPISVISKEDNVQTFNFEKGCTEFSAINSFSPIRKSEIYEIKTKFGNCIKTTKDHPFFTNIGYVYTSGLEKVSIPLFKEYSRNKELVLARLVGHIFGDGWLGKRGDVGFSGKKEDLLKIKEDLIILGISSSNLYKKDKPSKINSIDYGNLEVNGEGYEMKASRKCFKIFRELGVPSGRKVLQPSFIPNFIISGTGDIKREFLAALMGSDGYKIRIKNKNPDVVRVSFSKIESLENNSKEFATQIIKLFNSLGIEAKYWVRNGNIRKSDNLRTKKYIIDIANNNENFFKYVQEIGFRYCKIKEKIGEKALYYYKYKMKILNEKESLRINVLERRKLTGEGKIKLARYFCISVDSVKRWIYSKNNKGEMVSSGLGKDDFPTFEEWCNTYTDSRFIYDPVEEINFIGEEDVYNFSTNNGNFIANDTLVHNCPERNFKEAKSSPIIRSIAAEGRKFGLGLCCVSQRPARLDKNVLSQCNTQIILKLTNPNDLKAISSSVEGVTTETEDEIKNLYVGTAMVVGVVDMPLFVDIRPRMSKHGGDSINILETFAELGTNANSEVLNIIKPHKTIADFKIETGMKNVKTILIPCYMLNCVTDGHEFNLLININTAEIINNIETCTGKSLIKNLKPLSNQEERILNVALTMNGEFGTAELFSKSGVQFSDLFEIAKTLVNKNYFLEKNGKFTVSPDLELFLNLKNYSCLAHPKFTNIVFDEKREIKYDIQQIITFLSKFMTINSEKDVWLVKYEI